MKKKLLLSVLMMLFVGIDALAVDPTWTDDDGVTWAFSNWQFNVNGETKYYWTITGVSGYGEHVTIPSVVYDGETPRTIEAIGGTLFYGNTKITTIVLPPTIKYIFGDYYKCFTPNSGKVFMTGDTPPVLQTADAFGAGITILVPDASLDDYQQASKWSDIAVRIISKEVQTGYDVIVTAESNMSAIHQAIGTANLGNVMFLKVRGSINSYDFMIMRNKMHNLHDLDLTDATIKASDYEFLSGCKTSDDIIPVNALSNMTKLVSVKLPKSIKRVDNNAFANCQGLRSVDCQGVLEEIGNYAFASCWSLVTLNLNEGLKAIGQYAFHSTSNLDTKGSPITTLTTPSTLRIIGKYAFCACGLLNELNLNEGLEKIDDYAFSYCGSLTEITIPESIKVINGYAFANCGNLQTVHLPSELETIGYAAFRYCQQLKDIQLPSKLKSINTDAFNYCTSLTSIRIPGTVRSIAAGAYSNCNALQNIYCYIVEPPVIADNTFSTWTTANLYVPLMAFNNYYYDTQWSKFEHLATENTLMVKTFYLNNDYTFNDELAGETGETPDVDLEAGSGIIANNTTTTVTLGGVHMKNNGTKSGSIVAKDNLTVENLFFDMTVAANKWYFLSLPFRVKAENVTAPGPYVFRYYDGATRAANGKGGWKNHEGTYLEAHTGYIFQTNTAGTLTFQVEPADVSFSGATRQDALATHAAADAKNASWNFMGNPFPSYYDIDNTGYNAPITVWNGTSYVAVRPGDDQYQIGPFQAFFVQKPEAVTSVEFPFEGCHTYSQWADIVAGKNKAPRRAGQKNRLLVNLTIGRDETVDDRTRVVFNEQKTTAYELDCDAAKFLSSEPVAQLYSLDDEQSQYAINERPQGDVRLGYVAAEGGMLTITAERMDQPLLLYDKLMNIQHDLSTGGYMFSTEAGTFNDRFVMTINGHATAITQQPSPITQQPTDVFSLGGAHVSSKGTDGLSSGTYVVKQGSVSTKVIVK